jgi:hypothetical protein
MMNLLRRIDPIQNRLWSMLETGIDFGLLNRKLI